ncbi:MAG: carbohydrate binding domain-containing protein [Candidatus Sumerlaeia bacterium]|nr:carbohydrate binding domain-containing protein [Candidatus Sumerlaeia bacterium]
MKRNTHPKNHALLFSLLLFAPVSLAQAGEPSVPFHLPWEAPAGAFADARFSLDPPAGKHGPIVVRDGHLAFANAGRARFWGTNLTMEACVPPKDVAPRLADRIAKYGFNLVRFHGLDRSLFPPKAKDTRRFDPDALDRLDYLIAELEKRGIYINLNLHVFRKFLPGDGVAEADWLGYAKYCVIFDERMIELQKEYARNLLGHRNPYTGKTYAEDPAVIIIELTNENSLFGGWTRGQLRGEQRSRPASGWADIPPFYGAELTRQFNQWLARRYPSRDALAAAWGEGSRKAGPQMLANGDFAQGKTNWTLSVAKPAEAQFDMAREGGAAAAKVSVAKVTGTRWHVMLTQSGMKIRKGAKYAVSFRIKAASAQRVTAEVAHAGPGAYRGHGSTQTDAATDWSARQFTFVAGEDDTVRLSFQLGEAPNTVWIADVRMTEAAIDGLREDEDPAKGTVRRLNPEEFGSVTAARFLDEGRFLYDTEMAYYRQMYDVLKKELRVCALVEGTNHNYGLPCLWAESSLDLMDCHAYWQHPSFPRQPWSRTDWTIGNTAMLDAPERSTIASLSRSAVAGKPFTVSEYNHPFPNEYGCEMPLLIAAYGALQDWDAIYGYTFCHRVRANELGGNEVTGYFDLCNEVPKMAQMPTASLLFRRGDVRPAQREVAIRYTVNHLFDSLRDPRFRDGYRLETPLSPLLPLVHRFRVEKFDAGQMTRVEELNFTPPKGPIISDTGELTWNTGEAKAGHLLINTPRTQAAVGWIGGRPLKTRDLALEIDTPFCAVSATALDGKPLRASERILVVAAARCANTGMVWNEQRNSITDRWGGPPLLIEPVAGRLTLARDAGAPPLQWAALNGTGQPAGASSACVIKDGSVLFAFPPDTPTVWYALTRK